MRLGPGKLQPSDWSDDARAIFLHEVQTRHPEVLRDLRKSVSPHHPDGDWQERLNAWSREWELDADWTRRAARRTLEAWSAYEGEDPPLVFMDPSGPKGSLVPDVPFGFEPDQYNPLLETRTEARERIAKAFREHLTRYFDRVEDAFREAGYESTGSKANLEHLAWLASYQVGGHSQSEVARKYDLPSAGDPAKTVARAIRRTADEIDLPLRDPNPPGPKAS